MSSGVLTSAIVDCASVERESVYLSIFPYSVEAAMSAASALSDSSTFSWQRIAEVRGKEASDAVAVARALWHTARGTHGKQEQVNEFFSGLDFALLGVFLSHATVVTTGRLCSFP